MDKLLLLSGNDIPFIEGQVTIHQPTIKEIGYIGETTFYNGCNFLNFSKDFFLADEDKNNLESRTNFNVFMSIMNEKNPELRRITLCSYQVLALLFPEHKIYFNEKGLNLVSDHEQGLIYDDNFEEFKRIIKNIFCLNLGGDEQEYKPEGDLAAAIAKKLEERKRKLAAAHKGNADEEISILNKYVSILSVGMNIEMNALLNYSVYQLFDAFQRYNLYYAFEMNMKARLAGAKDVKEAEDWMKELHSNK